MIQELPVASWQLFCDTLYDQFHIAAIKLTSQIKIFQMTLTNSHEFDRLDNRMYRIFVFVFNIIIIAIIIYLNV